ncbi:MAG: PCRF domain-containing protein, partial [Candidatus Omnitrophica bacterium]|nr:PCRF domain-containing protein [Candidatus Omnitrophota bacterium]
MIQDINKQIEDLEKEICNLEIIFKIKDKKVTMQELQLKMSEKGFWDNSNSAAEVVNELKDIKGDIDAWDSLNNSLKDLKDISSICDESMVSDIMKEISQLKINSEALKLRILFSGKFDKSNAIVEINSGAGGTESCDWASMLFRMYFKWSEDKGFKFKVLNE